MSYFKWKYCYNILVYNFILCCFLILCTRYFEVVILFHIFTSKMYKTCKTPLLHKNILSIWFSSPQDNEKAVDEMRKFYSAQAAKHKEKMEQAVNYKACESLLHCGITVCESIHVLLIGAI